MRAVSTLIAAASATSLLAGAAVAQTRGSLLGPLGGAALGRGGGPLGMSNDLVCRVNGPDDGVHSVEQSARYRPRAAGFSTTPSRLAIGYTYASSVTTPVSGLASGKAGIKSTISGDPAVATPEPSQPHPLFARRKLAMLTGRMQLLPGGRQSIAAGFSKWNVDS